MWILLRSPKIKGAIFGFQKRVWCPKWTPASSICRMDTPDMRTPNCWVEPCAHPPRPLPLRKAPSRSSLDTRLEFAFVVANEGGALYHERPVGTMSYGSPSSRNAYHH